MINSEQLEFKLEIKILGFRNMQEKLENIEYLYKYYVFSKFCRKQLRRLFLQTLEIKQRKETIQKKIFSCSLQLIHF